MTDWDDNMSGEDQAEDEIIELTQIVENGSESGDDDILELTEIVGEDQQGLDLDIVTEKDPEDAADPGPAIAIDLEGLDVTQEQVMTALERVIEKKFSDKIETLLFEVLERVIQSEITEIRDSLQKDLDEIGNV